MSENYQQMSFTGEQEEEQSTVFRGGSRANLIALQESVKRLVMIAIYGQNSGELFAKLNQNGLWEKMYSDYYQASMDGSLEEFCETWPRWGTMRHGVLRAQQKLEPFIDESEWLLLPTPVNSEWIGAGRKRYRGSKLFRGAKTAEALRSGEKDPIYTNPSYCEIIMGYPMGWTEINASGTP